MKAAIASVGAALKGMPTIYKIALALGVVISVAAAVYYYMTMSVSIAKADELGEYVDDEVVINGKKVKIQGFFVPKNSGKEINIDKFKNKDQAVKILSAPVDANKKEKTTLPLIFEEDREKFIKNGSKVELVTKAEVKATEEKEPTKCCATPTTKVVGYTMEAKGHKLRYDVPIAKTAAATA